MSKKIGRMFLGAAAAAACLFVNGTAQAGVIYRGSFDPIEFMGIAEFDVDPGCILADGFIAAPGCGAVTMTSALVTNNGAPPVTDSIAFNPPFSYPGGVTGLYWSGGDLIGVDMSPTGYSDPPLNGSLFDYCCGYALEFVSGQAPGYDPQVDPPIGVNLYTCGDGCGLSQLDLEGTALEVVFERVPEPASLGLVLGALGVGWLTRRRRAKA